MIIVLRDVVLELYLAWSVAVNGEGPARCLTVPVDLDVHKVGSLFKVWELDVSVSQSVRRPLFLAMLQESVVVHAPSVAFGPILGLIVELDEADIYFSGVAVEVELVVALGLLSSAASLGDGESGETLAVLGHSKPDKSILCWAFIDNNK